MGGAAQARIVGAHQRRNAVQHTLFQLVAVDKVLGDLAHAIADGAVVVAGSDDQVRPDDGAVLVDVDGVAGERIVPNLSIAERKSVWSARSSVRSNFVL